MRTSWIKKVGGSHPRKGWRIPCFPSTTSPSCQDQPLHPGPVSQQMNRCACYRLIAVGVTPPFLKSTDMDSLTVPDGTGVRRSSLASTWSRDSGLSHRRLKPISSLSINDMACEAKVQPLPSPGLLSTHSMWSTSDLFSRPSSRQQDPEVVSNLTNSNSLSNVSSTLSERMHELVRAYSSRTQRIKEKTTQPPSPSSVSSQDAKSAISGLDGDETPAPRNIRLGSFIPMGSTTSEVFSEASETNKEMLVGVWQCRFRMPKCLRKIRFPNTIEAQSKLYVGWLFLVMLAYMYNAWVIPLRGFFPYQTADNVWYWLICDYTADLVYILDIAIFKVRIRFVNNGIIECDRKLTKKNYMKKLMFKLDVCSLLPLDLLYLVPGVGVNAWLRIPRLLKVQTFWEFYERCDQAANSSAHAIRIIKTMTYMLFLIHIETCGYYAVSVYEGINSNQWVYNGTGNAYIRCFYLATKTATSIGNNPKPQNQLEYLFMTLYWLSGVFVFALLIGQIRDIVEAAGQVKSNYRKRMDQTIRYMESINIPKEMQERVRQWFLYNWEQHKTIDERLLLETLPRKLQTDLAINVHFNTLSKVQLFQDCDKNLLYDLVLKLKPSLFLPQDYICYKGEVGKEMYIVSHGQVEVVGGEDGETVLATLHEGSVFGEIRYVVGGEDGETVLATLHEGSVFGEISLLAMSGGNRRTANVRSKGYTNVFTLSKADFEEAMREYPEAQKLLRKRAKKLLKENARLEKKSVKVEVEEIIKTPSETPKFVKTVIKVMDPESNLVKHLDPSLKQSSSLRSIVSRPSSRTSSGRSSRSSSQGKIPERKLSKKGQAAFIFGSEVSLSDIPNDARVEYDVEEEQMLVVERVEHELTPESVPPPQKETPVIEDKRTQILKDDLDKTNNSVESQDSGIPSMKRSASQSTDKSLSNQDSKDSFNTSDLMDVINEEKQKGDSGDSSIVDPPPEARQSPSGASSMSDVGEAECQSECRSEGSPVDWITTEEKPTENGTRRKVSSESRDEKSVITDGTRRKVSAESKEKVFMEDGTRRKVSTGSRHGAQSPDANGAQSPRCVTPRRGDKSVTEVEKHEIPLENKVTCAVEIHREKTRTPSSIFSLEHQERPGSNAFYRQNSNVSYETEL
ncbi:cyclic nucleotide-gated cation channel beta-1-like isoform X2 [Haliotis rubra]|uniref:cyclic nucleotide-gated cation channel beta-1-like isoform X2 n=1 Tax=Haliotis rubra TaxID=36100 RepID=UPI001EE5DF86|nr:cyclic nucleotide-gated cation channel beta-1-like isoform X2 [Haliotis rubra]